MNFGTFAYPILFVVFAFCLFFYVKNFIRATTALRNKEYTIKLALRSVGIFIPVVGVFMGMVPA